MGIISINTGTSANKGDGDTLRSAFNKINANFKYLNLASGISANADLSAAVFTDNTNHTGIKVTYNTQTQEASLTVLPVNTATESVAGIVKIGSGINIVDGVISIGTLTSVNSNIVPSFSSMYSLGELAFPWRAVYLGNGGVIINGTSITIGTQTDLLINGSPVAQGIQGIQGIQGGPAGVSVTSASVVSSNLIITLSDSTIVNAGDVTGPQGSTGTQGIQGPVGPEGPVGPQGIPGNYSIGNFSFDNDVMLFPNNATLSAGGAGVLNSVEVATTITQGFITGDQYTATVALVSVTDPTYGLIAFDFEKSSYPTLNTILQVGSLISGADLNGQLGYDNNPPVVYSINDNTSTWKIVSTLYVDKFSEINTGSGYDLTFTITPVVGIVDSAISLGVRTSNTTTTGVYASSTNVTVTNNSHEWQFNAVGQVVFPDTTVQTTAWTGAYATTSTDWSSPAPTTIAEAIDRLAAVVKALNSGTGA